MSKRSIRLVAGVAGAAMALGSMAPAMAERIGGDVDVTGHDSGLPVNVRCLTELPELFPINANVNPGHPLKTGALGGLLDVGLNDTDTTDGPYDGPHVGAFGFGLLGTYGIGSTLNYVLGGAINAGLCVTEPVLTCVGETLGRVFPLNVNVNPGHPVQTGSFFSGGLVGGLLDVGINDTDNVDSYGTDGPHLGVFGHGPLGIYGIPNTLAYTGIVAFSLVDCLGLENVLGVLNVVNCLGDLGDVFPLNANINPGDPFRGLNDIGGLVDVAFGDTDNVDDPDSGHLGIFGLGLLGTYGIHDTLEHLLGDTVDCIVHPGDDEELLSAVSGMSSLGGSPLALLGEASPVNSVVSLAGGLVTTTLNGSLTSILSGGGIAASGSLFASVAAVL